MHIFGNNQENNNLYQRSSKPSFGKFITTGNVAKSKTCQGETADLSK